MELNQILHADILDIVFDDRNKSYGAYTLRKTYNRRLWKALAITASIAFLAVLSSYLANAFVHKAAAYHVTDVTISTLSDPAEKPVVPPAIKMPPRVIATVQFTKPVIAPDDDVKTPIEENEHLDDKKIDVASRDGLKDDGLVTPAEIDDNKHVIEAKLEDDADRTFVKVEVEAQFPGGDRAWTRYLERNLRADVPAENGAPAGDYTIWVQFVVDREGNVSDVRPLTALGYGLEQEAFRVIAHGPQWKPAIQNGRNVKAYRTQPITFRISE